MLPDAIEVIEGQTAQLVAKAQGKPAPTITWLRNDKLVKKDDTVQLETTSEGLESTGTCVMAEIELAKEGRYTIEASNSVGKITADVPVTGKIKKNREHFYYEKAEIADLNVSNCV